MTLGMFSLGRFSAAPRDKCTLLHTLTRQFIRNTFTAAPPCSYAVRILGPQCNAFYHAGTAQEIQVLIVRMSRKCDLGDFALLVKVSVDMLEMHLNTRTHTKHQG